MEQLNQEIPKKLENIKDPHFEERAYTEQVLETIDNKQLRNFLIEQLRPAGFEEKALKERFYSAQDVTLHEQSPQAAAWADGERINFEPINFLQGNNNLLTWIEQADPSRDAYEKDKRHFDISKMQAVQIFIHEQLHHLTFTEYDYSFRQRSTKNEHMYRRKIGLQSEVVFEWVAQQKEQTDTTDEVETEERHTFIALNEGLTELMAQELTNEYIRQYPLIENAELARQVSGLWIEQGPYKEERLKIEQLAAIFAEMTEVSDDIVLKSFFNEYVNNGHLLPPEFTNVLSEFLPQAVNEEQLEEMVSKIMRAMSVETFDAKSDINNELNNLLLLLPKNKAHHCRDKLAKIFQKYYPSVKNE